MGCDGNKRPARVVKNGKEKRTEKLKVPRSLILTDALGPMICQRDLWGQLIRYVFPADISS